MCQSRYNGYWAEILPRPSRRPARSSATLASYQSWDASNSQKAQRGADALCRELFLLLLISHEQAAALVVKAEIGDAKHAHSQAHLRANRIERRIESFFGDAEIGDAHRHDARFAPDE